MLVFELRTTHGGNFDVIIQVLLSIVLEQRCYEL